MKFFIFNNIWYKKLDVVVFLYVDISFNEFIMVFLVRFDIDENDRG